RDRRRRYSPACVRRRHPRAGASGRRGHSHRGGCNPDDRHGGRPRRGDPGRGQGSPATPSPPPPRCLAGGPAARGGRGPPSLPEVRPLSLSLRNRELLFLIVVGVLTAVGFASVYVARQDVVSTGSLAYAGFFLLLYVAAHLVARYTVPFADPYLLPIAGLLTA